jgi:hypothetical protein
MYVPPFVLVVFSDATLVVRGFADVPMAEPIAVRDAPLM